MQHRSKEEWNNLLREHKESGQNCSEFCRERGISLSSFQLHKKKERSELLLPYVELPRAKGSDHASTREATIEVPGGAILRVRW